MLCEYQILQSPFPHHATGILSISVICFFFISKLSVQHLQQCMWIYIEQYFTVSLFLTNFPISSCDVYFWKESFVIPILHRILLLHVKHFRSNKTVLYRSTETTKVFLNDVISTHQQPFIYLLQFKYRRLSRLNLLVYRVIFQWEWNLGKSVKTEHNEDFYLKLSHYNSHNAYLLIVLRSSYVRRAMKE